MDPKEKLRRLLGSRPGVIPVPAGPPEPAAAGFSFCRQEIFPAGYRHGREFPGQPGPLTPNLLRICGVAPEILTRTSRLICLDTETTGLSGGTGTSVFLTGLLEIDLAGGGMTLTQHLLEDPSKEAAFLQAILDTLGSGGLLVTYNGKTFDLPLLQTRLVMCRLPALPAGRPMLDLLFPARRFWKSRLAGCDLQTLEREVLQFERETDIPGWLIPQAYFQYLRDRQPRHLLPVLAHNRLDLLSLAALLTVLNRRLDWPAGIDHQAAHSLLRYLEQHRQLEDFEALYQRHGPALEEAARRHAPLGYTLACQLKRSGRRQQAHQLFLQISQDRPGDLPGCIEEVLIYEEHHLKDWPTALDHCNQFMAVLTNRPDHAELRQQLEKRKARLLQKMARRREKPVRSVPQEE